MGLGTAPTEFWRNLSRAARSSSLVTSAPPITSECPPRYLVELCSTRSAPCESGFCR